VIELGVIMIRNNLGVVWRRLLRIVRDTRPITIHLLISRCQAQLRKGAISMAANGKTWSK